MIAGCVVKGVEPRDGKAVFFGKLPLQLGTVPQVHALDPRWTVAQRLDDAGQDTSLLNHVRLVALQARRDDWRNDVLGCKVRRSGDVVEEQRQMRL